MRTRNSRRFVAHALAVALVALIASSGLAQTDADLQAENKRLQAEIDQLKRDLKAAQDRVKLLEQQIAAMRRTGSASTQPDLEPEKVTIDESNPLASPRALRNHLTTTYEADMGAHEIGRAGDAKRRGYIRAVDRWAAAMNDKLKKQIDWRVRIVQPGPIQHGRPITVVAVDPVTDVRLGEPFNINVPRASMERLLRVEDRGDLGVLVLRGVLEPNVRVVENRETRGPIDNPPFIGPFAEFRMNVAVNSLVPAPTEEKTESGKKDEKPTP